MQKEYYGVVDAYIDSLSHHGILGQKWGIRRFQNPDGSLTPAGRARYYGSDGNLTEAGKKAFKDKNGNDTKAGKKYKEWQEANRPLTPEEKEARKQEAIASGDINKVYKARQDMTNNELRAALDRIDLERKISNLANAPEVSRGEEAINRSLKGLDTTTKIISSATRLWESYDNITSKLQKMKDKEFEKSINDAIRKGDYDFLKEHESKLTTNQINDFLNMASKKKEFDNFRSNLENDRLNKEADRRAEHHDTAWFMDNPQYITPERTNKMAAVAKATEDAIKMHRMTYGKDTDTQKAARALENNDLQELKRYYDQLPEWKRQQISNIIETTNKVGQKLNGNK